MYFDAESDILCLIICSACGCCIRIVEDGVGSGTSGEVGVAVWMPGMLWGEDGLRVILSALEAILTGCQLWLWFSSRVHG